MITVTYQRPVYYYETDRMDCVHHSNYIRWFEEARIHYMKEMGFSYEGLEEQGIVSPVLHAEADYKTMARFGETVCIEVGAAFYTGTRIGFSYVVRDRETGTVRCIGKTAHCFINAAGRPVALQKACPAYDRSVRRALEEGNGHEEISG